MNKIKSAPAWLISALALLLLAGCTVQDQNYLSYSLERTKLYKNRASEFAQTAPAAPYQAVQNREEFTQAAIDNNLLLDGQHLAMIAGAADKIGVDSALLATIIETELRNLDPGELERDVVSALAGENTSIGLGQVLVSTAEEIEKEDPADLMPDFVAGDTARTERVRRLAADDWSILYAGSYLKLLRARFKGESDLSLAGRYTGRGPDIISQNQQELLQAFVKIF